MHDRRGVGLLRRSILAAVLLVLTIGATPALAAPSVQGFRVFAQGDRIEYRVVLCAPVGTQVSFTTYLTSGDRRTYIGSPQTGRQGDVCPTWRFHETNRYPSGRYSASVRATVGQQVLRTPTRQLRLGGPKG